MNEFKPCEDLRVAYDRGAAQHDQRPKQDWKLTERAVFLDRLQAEQVKTLSDIALPKESFDAVYSINCLRHVPNAGLPSPLPDRGHSRR